MIEKSDFDEMGEELRKYDAEREKSIQLSREIIKESKLIIYAVQRGNLNEAAKNSSKIKAMMKKLPEKHYTEMISTAWQEYVEAMTFLIYVKENRLPTRRELGVETYEYLLGMCDLTGELMRKAVNHVIKGNISEVEKINSLVNDIYHEFLKFNLGNSELRKKSDQIKWNLEKLESILYDLKIKRG
jgi:translin